VSKGPAGYTTACTNDCAAAALARDNRALRRRVGRLTAAVARLEARVTAAESAHVTTLEAQARQLEDALVQVKRHRATARHLIAMREAAQLLRQALLAAGAAQGVRHTRDPLAALTQDHPLLCRWCSHPDHAGE